MEDGDWARSSATVDADLQDAALALVDRDSVDSTPVIDGLDGEVELVVAGARNHDVISIS